MDGWIVALFHARFILAADSAISFHLDYTIHAVVGLNHTADLFVNTLLAREQILLFITALVNNANLTGVAFLSNTIAFREALGCRDKVGVVLSLRRNN